jgi:Protein of unknown function (DUF2971)
MHTKRLDLDEPEDETILWRYFTLDKFRSMLNSSTLYLCRADKFDDPLEGITPGGTNKAIFEELPLVCAHTLIYFRNLFRGKMFVSCWHENSHESSTMWSAYGDKSNGVAVKTNAARLRQALIGSENCVVARVQYIDFNQDSGSNDTTKQMLQKRHEFSSEREIRIIHDVGMNGGNLAEVGQPDPRDGIAHAISLNCLIDEIVVGSLCRDEDEAEIRHLTQGLNLETTVRRSMLYFK